MLGSWGHNYLGMWFNQAPNENYLRSADIGISGEMFKLSSSFGCKTAIKQNSGTHLTHYSIDDQYHSNGKADCTTLLLDVPSRVTL